MKNSNSIVVVLSKPVDIVSNLSILYFPDKLFKSIVNYKMEAIVRPRAVVSEPFSRINDRFTYYYKLGLNAFLIMRFTANVYHIISYPVRTTLALHHNIACITFVRPVRSLLKLLPVCTYHPPVILFADYTHRIYIVAYDNFIAGYFQKRARIYFLGISCYYAITIVFFFCQKQSHDRRTHIFPSVMFSHFRRTKLFIGPHVRFERNRLYTYYYTSDRCTAGTRKCKCYTFNKYTHLNTDRYFFFFLNSNKNSVIISETCRCDMIT